MGWWRADPVPPPAQPPSAPSVSTASSTPPADESACPVDPKTRSLWLQQAQANKAKSDASQTTTPPPSLPSSHPPLPPTTAAAPILASTECSSDRITGQTASPPPTTAAAPTKRPLSQDRTVSTIPRASGDLPPTATSPSTTPNPPPNSETAAPAHPSGKWVYPSESQFYNAVMTKHPNTTSPDALLSSISHIIPIHNAVNERAWHLIKAWEGTSSDSCGGPKLHSFSGQGGGALSPQAKWNTWVKGTQEPFDRHDWVVERCGGEKVEYVIDFYQGKASSKGGKEGPENVNFYLDVRPKLNSVEGWRMRGERFLGWR